jgi:mannose-6-phosphate isomerase
MQWHPLRLTYHVRTYAFGARLIPDLLGKQGVPDGVVAETWEVSDYRETTGTIVEGQFAGQTLHEVTLAHPDEVVGEGWRGPHFPLLTKFLDASHMLPVHLHADDETAARVYGESNGKTEAWHILWCADDASILAGVNPGTSRDELVAAFKRQDYDAVMPRHPIHAGQTVYVPGGILHSFGPNTLIFEIQQTSDLGQNVMPTDLYGNRLDEATWDANIERTLAELKTTALPKPNDGLGKPNPDPGPNGNRYLIGAAGPHFALERWTLAHPHREPARPDRCLTLSNLGDRVTIAYGGGVFSLGKAVSCLIPAALGEFTIVPDRRTVVIACYVPDLDRDVVGPLRQAGHSDSAIRSLGDVPDLP